jgi:hypothetical protein
MDPSSQVKLFLLMLSIPSKKMELSHLLPFLYKSLRFVEFAAQ